MPLTPRFPAWSVCGDRPVRRGWDGRGYRARDAKLQRDVALKVLPEAFAADARDVPISIILNWSELLRNRDVAQ